MAYEVFIPKLGANMLEGKIESWYIQEGDEVEVGEPLFDLVTDKATVVVEAENRGIIAKMLVPEDVVVPIVTTVAVIAGKDEDISDLLAEVEERKKKEKEKSEHFPPKILGLKRSLTPKATGRIKREISSKLQATCQKTKASPKARKTAMEKGIDLADIIPSSEGGIITVEDVEKHIESMPGKKKVVIIGAGEYSRVILEILQMDDKISPVGFIDDNKSLHNSEISGVKVLGGSEILQDLPGMGISHFIVSVGVPKVRADLFNRCLGSGMSATSAIHPRACISESAVIEEGAVIEAFAVIAVNCRVERGVFVTQNCSVSHDCVLREFCHLAPGSHLGGSVIVGRGSLVGVGVSVAPHLEIGENVIITPGTSIDRTIHAGSVVEGVPGRIIGKTSFSI
ncbi:MAG: NeuD/PglB/VioB family sugar acetyltransferase [Candidatus Eremiobacteraeota bacterium]|nr:NeuD/PglB/VioB family sugar acetyltransferase [Candidatus Eremiobacteraeota bacterium]